MRTAVGSNNVDNCAREWEVLCRISTLMGYPMFYYHPSEIMDEIASLVSIYGGISYDRLEERGIQWPCPTKDHPGTTTLCTDLFPRPGARRHSWPLTTRDLGRLPMNSTPMS
ncbi:MAG: hypothetical protein F9K32_02615 [Desulfobulbaceae bacterium]|nr:MAG: hypothetical protein F9K32_02615 [Desulfobulbaceae bacterium]